ncbi:MAG: YgjP-like metallopeptidase domain-containing protein, partial [Bacteroidaceae bacterium]
MEYGSYTDSELGTIRIYMRRGVKRIIFRCKEGELVCTMPLLRKPGSELKQAINLLRPKLAELQKKQEHLAAQHPALSPHEIEVLRAAAKKELPELISLLADKYGFTFHKVTIRNTSSRWGS